MNLYESALEDLILSKLESKEDRANLGERGLDTRITKDDGNTTVWAQNQVNLHGYGISDIITVSVNNELCINIDIFELKVTPLRIVDIAQVLRYRTGVQHFMEYLVSTNDLPKKDYTTANIDCHLIGNGLDNDIKYFVDAQGSADNCVTSIFTYQFDAFNGLVFKDCTFNVYNIEEPKFNNKTSEDEEKSNFTDMIYSYQEYNFIQSVIKKDGKNE
jgi:hypothetical protein